MEKIYYPIEVEWFYLYMDQTKDKNGTIIETLGEKLFPTLTQLTMFALTFYLGASATVETANKIKKKKQDKGFG